MDFEREPGACEERWRDEVAAYALGTLSLAEVDAVEAHLEGCPHCAERLDWLRPAVDLLPASVRQIEPSPSLRQSLMSTVRADVSADVVTPSKPRVGVGVRLRSLLPVFSLRPALVAMATVLAVAAGTAGYELRGDSTSATDAVRTVDVRPTTPRIDASGSLEVRGDSALMQLSQLPQLPPDKVYQAWVRTGPDVEPSTVFVPNRWGVSSVGVDGELDGADEVMVTREPAGGSDEPQAVVILSAQLD